MPLDITNLRRLAEEAKELGGRHLEFEGACTPDAILSLLDELDAMREHGACDNCGRELPHKDLKCLCAECMEANYEYKGCDV